MTPLEFVQLGEKELKTLLENTSQKLGTTDLKEIIKSVVPIVEINGVEFELGIVFKKKLRIQLYGPSLISCSYLMYRVNIGWMMTLSGGEFMVDRYWREGRGVLKPIIYDAP